MRIAAGILILIGGLIGGSLWASLSGYLVTDFTQSITPTDPAGTAVILGFLVVLIRFLPLGLVVIGGIFTIKGTHWGWALTGAIFSLLFPFTGIPAIILLIKSKGDFE